MADADGLGVRGSAPGRRRPDGGWRVLANHAEEHPDQMEGLAPGAAMLAGALAGAGEHVCMYPADVIKTRSQAHSSHGQPAYRHPFHAASQIVRGEGVRGLYKGMPAVVAGAIPSHAVYFATYEWTRRALGAMRDRGHHPVANGVAGGVATMMHDAIVTPLDVVKQRLQLYRSAHSGLLATIAHVARHDGLRAFYVSYPTTVLMNVPFMSVHFGVYESLKVVLERRGVDGAARHGLAGAMAGALGGVISNPLDIIKTRLQLQGVGGAPRYTSARAAALAIWRLEGGAAFWRGTSARALYFAPGAAVSWTLYEGVKSVLLTVSDEHSS